MYDKTIKFIAWTSEFQELYDWETLKKEFHLIDFDDPDFEWYPFTGYTSPDGVELYEGHILTWANKENGVFVIVNDGGLLTAEYRYNIEKDQVIVAKDIPIKTIVNYTTVIGHVKTDPKLLEATT